VDAPELKAWLDSGRDMVVLDSRPLDEFHRMAIPGAINVPGGELVYRIGDIAPDPATLVVVNCAGRTRSILGAESLRRAGIPNRVVALRNGTMGWELAGFTCARDRTERFAPGTPRSVDLAAGRAARFAEAVGVRVIGATELARLEADATRTLHVLDVRDPPEFAAAHRPGSRNAPGGQLVQATDRWVAVRGARIALIDDTGVRARMTAAWLKLMGRADVMVVDGALEGAVPVQPAAAPAGIGLPALDAAMARKALVVDLARSIDFRAGHIPGAVWGMRSRLEMLAPQLSAAPEVVLTCPDGVLAARAVPEAMRLTPAPVSALAGGTASWRRAGRALMADRTDPPDEACVDFYLRPYDRNSGIEEAMHAYLSWEIDLVAEIARDGTVVFGAPG